MNIILCNKGISLLEVAFLLIALTLLSLFITDQVSIRSKYLESKIIADQIKTVSAALNVYIMNMQSIDSKSFPLEVKNSILIKEGYLTNSMNNSSYLFGRESNYVIKLKSTENNNYHFVGLTFLCFKEMNNRKSLIVNDLGFDGGATLNIDSSVVIGASGGWSLNVSNYKSIFSNSLIKNINDCVFSLNSYEPIVDKSGSLSIPKVFSDKFSLSGMVSGNKISLINGGDWGPLYKNDALILTNNNSNKDIIVEIKNNKNEILLRNHYSGVNNKIFISDKYIGQNIYLKIIPIDSAGHEGDSVVIPNHNNLISIRKFKGNLFKKIIFQVKANIFNSDFSIPNKPKNDTRSDIGECSDVQTKWNTPAGIDVEGVKLDLIRSKQYSPYLTPHVINLSINNDTVLNLKILNPSSVPFNNFTWGTYDMRYNHTPLIPGAEASGNGFFLLTNSCLKSDRKEINFDIKVDGDIYYNLNYSWSGNKPLWKEKYISA